MLNINLTNQFNKTVSKTTALTSLYPNSDFKRTSVPQDKISWSVPWPDYIPVDYTAPSILKGPVWADPPIGSTDFTPRYEKDGKVECQHHNGKYDVVDRYPRNHIGCTGLKGRGLLGRWDPNHAADPIVTRWKSDRSGEIIMHPVSEKPVLQFISIKRLDCGEWAIPVGMVDPGEKLSVTLKWEFGEEALNFLQKSESVKKKKLQDKL
ncbi:ADP-ribose pyrophosphatase, mitochondrial-like [Protopterus annectens]|uniref:ADP-ribose pyrophosphatase, mitochondrial-like n=1 Tax=Protopterus annectens TaxID=7888 RepID=UPI001CFC070B|nr:ADP-ribose pyrophosphatase, mitochondrial-like [Protopterus annectens]